MKKLDKLILLSFLGPFILTFLVSDFILLMIFMLKYFDDMIGKNLGFDVFSKLMMYFGINMIPTALPLGVLVSSLMTYGQLGEHFELTAIKGSGISLVRVLRPTFIFVALLSVGAFFMNNHLVPYANLRAFSLLYDIKQAKPAMDLQEGQFYTGLPKYSIKVKEKYPDGKTMKEMVIYDHNGVTGNKKVIMADSARMFTFLDDRYLKLELFNGNHYLEQKGKNRDKDAINQFARTNFNRMDMVFSLASFGIGKTDMDLFANNRYMKSTKLLQQSIDSMSNERVKSKFNYFNTLSGTYLYHQHGFIEPPADLLRKYSVLDSIKKAKQRQEIMDSLEMRGETKSLIANKRFDSLKALAAKKKTKEPDKPKFSAASGGGMDVSRNLARIGKLSRAREMTTDGIERRRAAKLKDDSLRVDNDSLLAIVQFKMDSVMSHGKNLEQSLSRAASNARSVKVNLSSMANRQESLRRQVDSHVVEKYKKYAQALSVLVMFLIGAPLGAIIKRGGLGLPIIVAIFFFIIFYVFTSAGDKWAKSGVMSGFYAAWMANAILLPWGILFLKQARSDAKVFDPDFYNVWIEDVRKWLVAKKLIKDRG